jgi:hypothetical protein
LKREHGLTGSHATISVEAPSHPADRVPRRGTSSCQYRRRSQRLRSRWIAERWRAPCLRCPGPASVTGGAGARPDHPISGHHRRSARHCREAYFPSGLLLAVPIVNPILLAVDRESGDAAAQMFDLCKLIVGIVVDLLRSRAMLEAEILMLRQQINVLRRANPKRLRFASIDRLILGGICRLFPKMYDPDPIP